MIKKYGSPGAVLSVIDLPVRLYSTARITGNEQWRPGRIQFNG